MKIFNAELCILFRGSYEDLLEDLLKMSEEHGGFHTNLGLLTGNFSYLEVKDFRY